MLGKIAIAIPIELKNRQDVAAALSDRYGTDYLFSEQLFQEKTTGKSCHIITSPILDNNFELIQKLQSKKQDRTTLTTLQNINRSQQIIHLTGDRVGYEACLTMARFTRVFLNLGGLAVNIKSAEVATKADKWLANYNSKDVFDIYSLYVGLVEGQNNYYSCGMHNFGKADVSIELTENIGLARESAVSSRATAQPSYPTTRECASLAIYVMNVFNYYRLTESPILQDGHTFQPDIESPRYQMKLVEDKEYEINSLQHNSWGRWCLKRC